MRPLGIALACVGLFVLVVGCADVADAVPTPLPTTDEPVATRPPPTASPTPPATPTQTPPLSIGEAIIVGGDVRTRTAASSQSEPAGILPDLQRIAISQRVEGEDWLAGEQTWLASTPSWAKEWVQLDDGRYVYRPFVFILGEGETSPLEPVAEGIEKWIDIDLSEQVARAMAGDQPVFVARMSSGAAPFETPSGSFAIEPDGRIAVERMTATQAGYEQDQAQYDVERVLFTQYFDRSGNALHLNYWRPPSVFGNTPTSHGCIGLQLHEAQYLWLFAQPGMRVEIHE